MGYEKWNSGYFTKQNILFNDVVCINEFAVWNSLPGKIATFQ